MLLVLSLSMNDLRRCSFSYSVLFCSLSVLVSVKVGLVRVRFRVLWECLLLSFTFHLLLSNCFSFLFFIFLLTIIFLSMRYLNVSFGCLPAAFLWMGPCLKLTFFYTTPQSICKLWTLLWEVVITIVYRFYCDDKCAECSKDMKRMRIISETNFPNR